MRGRISLRVKKAHINVPQTDKDQGVRRHKQGENGQCFEAETKGYKKFK